MTLAERCEAYVSARRTLKTLERAIPTWPKELAAQATIAAKKTIQMAAEGAALDAPAGRRRCARNALTAACDLAAACDIARALGLVDASLEEALTDTARTIALLGLFFKASS